MPITPAPWRVTNVWEGTDDRAPYVVTADGDLVAALDRSPHDTPDAALISAAPDLLAACEFALSVLTEQGLYDMSEKMAATKLRNAIAKAKGRGGAK